MLFESASSEDKSESAASRLFSSIKSRFSDSEVVSEQPEVSKYVELLPKEEESCCSATD